MQRRGFFLLAVATVILVVAAAVALATGPAAVTRVPPGRHAFPGLGKKLGEVASVGLLRKGLRLTFVRKGDGWVVPEKGDFPADAGKVRQIVLGLAELTLVEPKTREKRLYPRLEVEDPGKGKATLVWLKDKSGTSLAALIVGKRSYDRLGTGTDAVYVRKPGHAQSWLARGSLDFSGDASHWLARHIVNIPEQRIAKLTLTQPDGSSLTMSRAAAKDKFAIAGQPPGHQHKSQTSTAEPEQGLDSLDLEDVRPAAKLPVPEHGVTTAAYRTFDGLTIDVRLFAHDKRSWVALSASGTGKAADEAKTIEARVKPWVYAIPGYKATAFKTRLADLLPPPK